MSTIPPKQVDAVVDDLETVANVERDQNGGETVWFDSVEAGPESRQRNQDIATILERAHFYGLVVVDVDYSDESLRLQHPVRIEWSK